MVECNADEPLGPKNVFRHLTKPQRAAAATAAIAVAKENTLHGVAYVLKQEDYQRILERDGFACDAYSFLLWTALIHVSKWRDQNRPNDDLSLYFEQGYSEQNRAAELLKVVAHDPRFKQDIRLTGHAFFKKDASYPGQAADLLAWNVRKGYVNLAAGKPQRKDTLALWMALA